MAVGSSSATASQFSQAAAVVDASSVVQRLPAGVTWTRAQPAFSNMGSSNADSAADGCNDYIRNTGSSSGTAGGSTPRFGYTSSGGLFPPGKGPNSSANNAGVHNSSSSSNDTLRCSSSSGTASPGASLWIALLDDVLHCDNTLQKYYLVHETCRQLDALAAAGAATPCAPQAHQKEGWPGDFLGSAAPLPAVCPSAVASRYSAGAGRASPLSAFASLRDAWPATHHAAAGAAAGIPAAAAAAERPGGAAAAAKTGASPSSAAAAAKSASAANKKATAASAAAALPRNDAATESAKVISESKKPPPQQRAKKGKTQQRVKMQWLDGPHLRCFNEALAKEVEGYRKQQLKAEEEAARKLQRFWRRTGQQMRRSQQRSDGQEQQEEERGQEQQQPLPTDGRDQQEQREDETHREEEGKQQRRGEEKEEEQHRGSRKEGRDDIAWDTTAAAGALENHGHVSLQQQPEQQQPEQQQSEQQQSEQQQPGGDLWAPQIKERDQQGDSHEVSRRRTRKESAAGETAVTGEPAAGAAPVAPTTAGAQAASHALLTENEVQDGQQERHLGKEQLQQQQQPKQQQQLGQQPQQGQQQGRQLPREQQQHEQQQQHHPQQSEQQQLQRQQQRYPQVAEDDYRRVVCQRASPDQRQNRRGAATAATGWSTESACRHIQIAWRGWCVRRIILFEFQRATLFPYPATAGDPTAATAAVGGAAAPPAASAAAAAAAGAEAIHGEVMTQGIPAVPREIGGGAVGAAYFGMAASTSNFSFPATVSSPYTPAAAAETAAKRQRHGKLQQQRRHQPQSLLLRCTSRMQPLFQLQLLLELKLHAQATGGVAESSSAAAAAGGSRSKQQLSGGRFSASISPYSTTPLLFTPAAAAVLGTPEAPSAAAAALLLQAAGRTRAAIPAATRSAKSRVLLSKEIMRLAKEILAKRQEIQELSSLFSASDPSRRDWGVAAGAEQQWQPWQQSLPPEAEPFQQQGGVEPVHLKRRVQQQHVMRDAGPWGSAAAGSSTSSKRSSYRGSFGSSISSGRDAVRRGSSNASRTIGGTDGFQQEQQEALEPARRRRGTSSSDPEAIISLHGADVFSGAAGAVASVGHVDPYAVERCSALLTPLQTREQRQHQQQTQGKQPVSALRAVSLSAAKASAAEEATAAVAVEVVTGAGASANARAAAGGAGTVKVGSAARAEDAAAAGETGAARETATGGVSGTTEGGTVRRTTADEAASNLKARAEARLHEIQEKMGEDMLLVEWQAERRRSSVRSGGASSRGSSRGPLQDTVSSRFVRTSSSSSSRRPSSSSRRGSTSSSESASSSTAYQAGSSSSAIGSSRDQERGVPCTAVADSTPTLGRKSQSTAVEAVATATEHPPAAAPAAEPQQQAAASVAAQKKVLRILESNEQTLACREQEQRMMLLLERRKKQEFLSPRQRGAVAVDENAAPASRRRTSAVEGAAAGGAAVSETAAAASADTAATSVDKATRSAAERPAMGSLESQRAFPPTRVQDRPLELLLCEQQQAPIQQCGVQGSLQQHEQQGTRQQQDSQQKLGQQKRDVGEIQQTRGFEGVRQQQKQGQQDQRERRQTGQEQEGEEGGGRQQQVETERERRNRLCQAAAARRQAAIQQSALLTERQQARLRQQRHRQEEEGQLSTSWSRRGGSEQLQFPAFEEEAALMGSRAFTPIIEDGESDVKRSFTLYDARRRVGVVCAEAEGSSSSDTYMRRISNTSSGARGHSTGAAAELREGAAPDAAASGLQRQAQENQVRSPRQQEEIARLARQQLGRRVHQRRRRSSSAPRAAGYPENLAAKNQQEHRSSSDAAGPPFSERSWQVRPAGVATTAAAGGGHATATARSSADAAVDQPAAVPGPRQTTGASGTPAMVAGIPQEGGLRRERDHLQQRLSSTYRPGSPGSIRIRKKSDSNELRRCSSGSGVGEHVLPRIVLHLPSRHMSFSSQSSCSSRDSSSSTSSKEGDGGSNTVARESKNNVLKENSSGSKRPMETNIRSQRMLRVRRPSEEDQNVSSSRNARAGGLLRVKNSISSR